ncbi:MAG: hypothetical protein H3C43_02635 [Leptonema sp. (in: Bacteria)]|nr:hypothetical protein [Leptonema sp. (in: bacteria)]
MRKMIILSITVFLIFGSSLFGRGDRMTVLPFRISGKPPAAHFNEAELSNHAMYAAVFLTKSVRDYQIQPNTLIKTGLDDTAAEAHLNSICSDLSISHALGGQLLFIGPSEVTVNIFTASCVRKTILYRDQSTGSVNDLQSLMRKTIIRTTPFLAENLVYSKLQNTETIKDNHIQVVIDLSGSMELTLPFIRRALDQFEPSVNRRITLTTIRPQTAITHSEPFADLSRYRSAVAALHGSGITTEADIIEGLKRTNDSIKANTRQLLFFSDANFSEKGVLDLQQQFREFRRDGIQVAFFPCYDSDPSFLEKSGRFDRVAKVYATMYGRRASFTNGEAWFFVRKGAAFYVCSESFGSDMSSGKNSTDSCRLFPAHRYSKSDLDLNKIAQAYASRNNLKVNEISPVYSDLEFRIADFITNQSGSRAVYRVLVANDKQAFWIGLQNKSDYNLLAQNQNQKIYVGLHLKRTPIGIENLPNQIYLTKPADTPQLFVLDYQRLLTATSALQLNPRDVWFFLVEVKDFRHD